MAHTWFITGTSRGLGAEIAKAALSAGHNVVATGRNIRAVTRALGPDSDLLLAVQLDVTNAEEAATAVNAAVSRFGGIDVLVNNAGYGQLGFFEENTLDAAKAQFDANLFGTLIVTWAALPVMREARKGRIFNISSLAGIRGSQTGSIYCASKFAVEGFSESLAQEVAPFGLSVTMIEPGLFRTNFLDDTSVRFGERPVADYADQSAKLRELYRNISGQQKGDPQKLALAIVQLANEGNPPLRFAAGSDAVAAIEAKIEVMRDELNRWRKLSISTDGYQ
jgi:NAD(P)-dependent dehydrogenase (short-subunit alcohol dehydrogenase family)